MRNIDRQVITEVLEILNHTNSEILNKIPEKFIKFLYEHADKEYEPNIDFTNEYWENEIKQDTKTMIALIYRDYIVSKEEKEKLIIKEQEELIEEEKRLHAKYNPDNLFT